MSIGEIRALLTVAEESIVKAWQNPEESRPNDEARTILDRVTQLGLVLLESREFEFLGIVIQSLAHLYGIAGNPGPSSTFVTPLGTDVEAERWRDIATRVYIIGAAAVRMNEFQPIRNLVIQQSNPSRRGRLWLRDTVTALARQQRFQKKSLIGPISDFITERPDFFNRFHNQKDAAVDSLCQFDFLQCIVAVAETGDFHSCYPNFGAYYNERVEPIVIQLVNKGPARSVVPSLSDQRLAEIIDQLDLLVSHEFFDFAGWHRADWTSREVKMFLKNLLKTSD